MIVKECIKMEKTAIAFIMLQVDILRKEKQSGKFSDKELIDHMLSRFGRIETVLNDCGLLPDMN